MVLPIRLTLLEGLDVANIVLWVTWFYFVETWKYDEGVMKRMGDWYVIHKGMLFPCVGLIFTNLDIQCHSHSKSCSTGLPVIRACMCHM